MPVVYTIGFTKKSAAEFFELLTRAGVDAVIDIRLRNKSQLAGWAKGDDLRFFLKAIADIGYEHHVELAPTAEILDGYRGGGSWDGYVRAFLPLLEERKAAALGREILQRHKVPCLLCSEPTPEQCHRRLVAEYWAEHLPDLKIVHL